MCEHLERKGYKVKILCTDGYEGYASYKLADKHPRYQGRETFSGVKKFTDKAFDMIFNSLLPASILI